jgi:hypothetical protein
MDIHRRVKGECQRCGFTVPLQTIAKEWSGLRVCPPCFDPRPAEMSPPRVTTEGKPLPNAAPETPIIERAPGDKGNKADL